MNKRELFQFNTVESAIKRQRELAKLVIDRTPPSFSPGLLCGLDAAYADPLAVGVAAVWDSRDSKIVETARFQEQVKVGYFPGLLGFREGSVLVSAAGKLRSRPGVFLVDGHGRAHPRRFGSACQIGLALDEPTVGVAKSAFYGRIRHGRITGPEGTVLGRVLGTSLGRTFYVSVGHRISIEDAVLVVKGCMVNGYPAPLRAAHLESVRFRRGLGH